MRTYSLFDCLDLALDNRHMLAGPCNVDDNTKASKLVDHYSKSTFAISTELDTIEISAFCCVEERSDPTSDNCGSSILYWCAESKSKWHHFTEEEEDFLHVEQIYS